MRIFNLTTVFLFLLLVLSCKKQEQDTLQYLYSGDIYPHDADYYRNRLKINLERFKIIYIKNQQLEGININDSVKTVTYSCNGTGITPEQTFTNIINIDTLYALINGKVKVSIDGNHIEITKKGNKIDTVYSPCSMIVDSISSFIFNKKTGQIIRALVSNNNIEFGNEVYYGSLTNQVPSDGQGNYYLLNRPVIYQLTINALSGTYSANSKYTLGSDVSLYRMDKEGNLITSAFNSLSGNYSYKFINYNNGGISLDTFKLSNYIWRGLGGYLYASTNKGRIYKFKSTSDISVVKDFNSSWSFLTDIDLYNKDYLIYNQETNKVVFAGQNQVVELDHNMYTFKTYLFYNCNCSSTPRSFLCSKDNYFSLNYNLKLYSYPLNVSNYALSGPNILYDFSSMSVIDIDLDYNKNIFYCIYKNTSNEFFVAEINVDKQYKIYTIGGEISSICKL